MRTIENFWNSWKSEYLLELRDAHRYHQRGRINQQAVQVGDVVIIEEDNLPRGFWRLATVTELSPGQDGEVRAATVRTHNTDGKPACLKRPIQKLYPLEINDSSESQEHLLVSPAIQDEETEEVNSMNLERRPRRAAAEQARSRIASWAKEISMDIDEL
jgi:hypothetical protein